MENAITLNLSPLQLLLSLAIQIWIVVAPILIIRKLDHLTRLLQSSEDDEQPQS